MPRLLLLALAVLAACTITTRADDPFGNRIQTPPLWHLLPGTATELHAAANNGSAQVSVFSYPPNAICETLFGRASVKLAAMLPNFRWTNPRPWHDKDQYFAGASYNGGGGTAFCVITPKEAFVVALTARSGAWEHEKETLFQTADSFRRKATGDTPVFHIAPLKLIRPNGTIINPDEN